MFAITSDTPVPSRAARIFTAWAMGAVKNIETLTLSSVMDVPRVMTVSSVKRINSDSYAATVVGTGDKTQLLDCHQRRLSHASHHWIYAALEQSGSADEKAVRDLR